MKHEITSLNTKRMLADSLKRFMEQKPLSKITISEIIADCGVNRKTFYYHFTDIYDLVKWMFEQETVLFLEQFDFPNDTEAAIRYVLDYVDRNRHIVNCAYDALGRSEMRQFFYKDVYRMIGSSIEKLEQELQSFLTRERKDYIIRFFTEGMASMLIDYVQSPKKCDREAIIQHTVELLKVSIPHLIVTMGLKK